MRELRYRFLSEIARHLDVESQKGKQSQERDATEKDMGGRTLLSRKQAVTEGDGQGTANPYTKDNPQDDTQSQTGLPDAASDGTRTHPDTEIDIALVSMSFESLP
jgi:hypothetical protein